jgi:integrase/recombinase XerD
MKKLILTTTAYQYLIVAFTEWLDILGYSKGSVYTIPCAIREFLHYLETNNIKNINQLQQKNIKSYHGYISTRSNQRIGGALSNNYINKHIQAIEKFLEYLHHKGVQNLPSTGIRLAKLDRKEITILTTEEIKELFTATTKESNNDKELILQSRDRVLLVIYYSCGLRKNEGAHVSIDDINFDTGILHVRKGKNYKERYVPFNKANAAYLQEWVYDYRSQLITTKKEHHLFVNINGEPMNGGSLYTRFKLLQLQTESLVLQQKNVGLHALRHSIATHLLQNGMSLEKIAKFLGHSSLDSTQIYTHLIKKTDERL